MILAIETATDVCSIVYCDSNGALFEKRTEERGGHSEKLFLFIERLMEEQDFNIGDLEAVVISEGPGSYTGLRIGASAVKGLLFHQNIPLFGVNTLTSFACGVMRQQSAAGVTIHSILDARRKHFYYRPFIFQDGKLKATDEVMVIPIADFEERVRPGDLLVGTGLDRMDGKVRAKVSAFGISAISAKSLVKIYKEQEGLLTKREPAAFSPKYYTSNQVS